MAAHKILVVDDSPLVRQQLRMALMDAGFDVIEAVDGQDGVNKIRSTPNLAAVVCDINMPGMNGIQVIETVRKEGYKMPIAVLSTEGNTELMMRGKKAGCQAWMIKPFKADILVAALKKMATMPR